MNADLFIPAAAGSGLVLVCGVDEAGRGPLCGPVVAAAVVLDPARPIEGLNDSKKLSERARERLAPLIREHALAWAIAEASVEEIDRLNILHATMLAMQRAVHGLGQAPTQVLIDGNRCPALPYPTLAIVKGDATEPSISAASILAKTARDASCVPSMRCGRNMDSPRTRATPLPLTCRPCTNMAWPTFTAAASHRCGGCSRMPRSHDEGHQLARQPFGEALACACQLST